MVSSTATRLLRTAFTALALGAIATTASAATVSGLKPVATAPTDDNSAPGLAVEYLRIKVRHVDEVVQAGMGSPGEPLPALDYNSGDGKVLTSGRSDEVGAHIRGLMHFPTTGTYILTIQSNDGVRLKLNDRLVVEDPDVHSDQYSEYVNVVIDEAGWYDLYVIYFERKGTSTLELYWQTPGSGNFELVPAEAFRHMKN
ncbi:MAG: PA14 domain-containing protein [Alphaproteobacteria bacterium]